MAATQADAVLFPGEFFPTTLDSLYCAETRAIRITLMPIWQKNNRLLDKSHDATETSLHLI